MNLPKFKIGDLEMNLILGAMAVGITGKRISSAVADCEGAGTIGAIGWGAFGKFQNMNPIKADREGFRNEIRAAQKMSNGVIGVNIMRALTDYEGLVKVAVEENVDMIISGAGLSKDLPKLVGDKPIKLIPIVSNQRTAKIMKLLWAKYDKVPDAYIVEGPEAGGHLGFKYEDLINNPKIKLENILKGVVDFANNDFKNPVPVIAAGGIYTGQDILKYQRLGAAGVQMGTRFVTTLECDAADEFKQTYLNANEEDIQIIKSPVGMPGRAIINPFLEKVKNNEEIYFKCKSNCLHTCDPNDSPYCIKKALVGAKQGNFEEGFAFAGTKAYLATEESCLDDSGKFIAVKTLMERLSQEYHIAKEQGL
ncbi:MAG: nitronate monooxygenase [Nanoarchaeota archaeon]|nr:nitronate monooxygenase [Nanoarchaeota archaeon]